jgi:hypothetical protein
MNKTAAKRDSDGHIIVIQTNGDVQAILDQMPDGPYTVVGDASELNLNRKYRDCWRDDGGGNVAVDMTLARTMKMNETRAERDAMLEKSDKVYIEELTKGLDTTDVEADKTALRDMTVTAQTAVDAIDDPDELETYDAFAGLSLNKEYE